MDLISVEQRFPNFDQNVPSGGYRWWYCDALSADQHYGITLIAFIGSVFSPYYARARRRGKDDDPLHYCSLNVALYGKPNRWTMTERGRKNIRQSASEFVIGPSAISWDGSVITIQIDEISVPLPSRIRGQVRIHPETLGEQAFLLDPAGLHRWWPVAPCAHVEVELEQPALSWSGNGYFDSNSGEAPLEQGFRRWSWSRASISDGAAILYDVISHDEQRRAFALHCQRNGKLEQFELPQLVRLPSTRWWRIERESSAEQNQARVLQTLEDTPFYARSLLSTRLRGEQVHAVHESLSLDRFRQLWVQCLLPFRMPRLA